MKDNANFGDSPRAHGPAPVTGRIRLEPEDFRVEEILGFDPDGIGSHALLQVEKTSANSAWVAGQLARSLSIRRRDVGFAGQKDRNAVTVQWFSVPLGAQCPVESLAEIHGPGYRVLTAVRHGRKLRPGSHRANRFHIRVREVSGDKDQFEVRMRIIADEGVPNYYGPQRFGRRWANLHRARDWARTGREPDQRGNRGFALSAARSWLFNLVLAARVETGSWQRILPGEAVILDGSNSFFGAPDDQPEPGLVERCRRLDVHPSGPLWGRGEPPVTGSARELECRAVSGESELCGLLAAQGLKQERRSLRLPVRGLDWQFEENDIQLVFELPRGTFATAVLHEIVETDPAG